MRIRVGLGSCGIAAGGKKVVEGFEKLIEKHNLDISVETTGCIGMCFYEPIVDIIEDDSVVTYGYVDETILNDIFNSHILNGNILDKRVIYTNDKADKYELAQTKVVLRNCGLINPERINDYIEREGYIALDKVLSMKPNKVIDLVKDSGLRGRGGGGFSTGRKWEFAYNNESDVKYVICNADEGDPGAFMDRSILEGDPHSVIEAMAIAGYAINANYGYVYIRAEYPVAVERLQLAINQAKEKGYLGSNILESGFSFDLEIRLGAGAFVCGEEMALIASIEGERGMPRTKPPFPANKGLWGKPTIINNVETFSNIPSIVRNGSKWFKSIGTPDSPGTKVFALGGKLKNSGLIEVPMGISLREVIYDVAGGMQKGRKFKAVLTGGPSGGCLSETHLDEAVDFDNLTRLGSMMGSGGMIVLDDRSCMVDIAKFYMDFMVEESCGKCTPCREGTLEMYTILDSITKGAATMEDLDNLMRLASTVKETSLCGLGQTAPNPVLSTLEYFYDEYLAHINDKLCPAGVCKDLIAEYFITGNCTGCTICAKNCPVECISGERKELHVIDKGNCILCGECFNRCPFDAIITR